MPAPTSAPPPTTQQVALLRVARGLLEDCRLDGHGSRTLPTTTDALVVHALVAAGARREGLPIVVSRNRERLAADLVDATRRTPVAPALSTWSIVADRR